MTSLVNLLGIDPQATPACPPVVLLPYCNVAITHYRGDSLALTVQVWDDAAQTVASDLTGATVTGAFKIDKDDPDPPVEEWGVAISLPNTILLTLTPAKSKAMPDFTYWDVQVDWLGDGTRVTTVITGTLTEVQDVTP
jgi:hypothetical protein